MRFNNFVILFILVFALIIIRPDPIQINADDYHVFNYVRDIVEKPSYFSWTGGGYRIIHRLIYLPIFWFYDFDAAKVAFPALLVTSIFDLALIIAAYFMFKRLFNWRVAVITVFLLMASHIMVRATWIWGGTHQIIATFFLLLSLNYLTKNSCIKNLFLSSIFAFLAIFTRESFSVIVGGIFIIAMFFNKRYLFLKNYLVLFWPFVLFGGMVVSNLYVLGGILRADAARHVNPSLNNVINLAVYGNYFFTSFLIILFGIVLFISIMRYRNYLNSISGISYDKAVLFAWLFSGIAVLLATTNTSISYIVPILPVIFVFVAKIIDDFLFSDYENFFSLFQKCLFCNLLFWWFIFSATIINDVSGLSYYKITNIANVCFYALILYAFLAPIIFAKKQFSYLRFKVFVGVVVFVAFSLTSFVQLGLTYSYFTFWHNYTDALNEATAFIAKYAAYESVIVTNPITPLAGPITGMDSYWFEAFRRTDLQVVSIDKFISLNFTGNYIYVGTPTSRIDTDLITPFVYSRESEFKLVAKFGSELQKYPSLRIPNKFGKAVSQFLETKLLFKLEPLQGYVVLLFEKKRSK